MIDLRTDVKIAPGFYLKNYINLSLDEKRKILFYRNKENIRKWMNSTTIIQEEDHLRFIDGLSSREDVSYWAILVKESIIGGFSCVDIINESSSTGIFIDEEYANTGIGLVVAYYVNEFLFNIAGFNELHSTVNKQNKNAVAMNLFQGFELINIPGEFYNISLKADKWAANSKKVYRLVKSFCI